MNKLLEYFDKGNFKELQEYINTHSADKDVIELKEVIEEYIKENEK